MTPADFVMKYQQTALTERALAQSHFNDLCALLNEPTPTSADPTGEWYAFERGLTKTDGRRGWADVWKKGHFAWEYKRRGSDLKAALVQLQQYALALENPPLLIVCNIDTIQIQTNWTNSPSKSYTIALQEIIYDPQKRNWLKWALSDPERLRPGGLSRQAITEKAAQDFSVLAERLRGRGHPPQTVAHFLNRLIFCMFAEDVDLLPAKMFQRVLGLSLNQAHLFQAFAETLFRGMKTGGWIGLEEVAWFNGGLFDDDEALPLERDDILLLQRIADLDWSAIDPSIMGTLFERGLDKDKRGQLGAHYTDRDKIMLIIEPVIIRPLRAEWEATKAAIIAHLDKAGPSSSPKSRANQQEKAQALYLGYLERLSKIRVLDPACGSGNFLYLALHALKDLENIAGAEAEALGLTRQLAITVGPQALHGIEINPYAAELARTSLWIGDIQWLQRNGFGLPKNPVLKSLNAIECRDALLNEDGTPATWPDADFIIGNPPFIGDKKMKKDLGDAYTARVRAAYAGLVPGGADFVCFWFAKADQQMRAGRADRVGLVSTNSIRGGANRKVLSAILDHHAITDAWGDEPWTQDGAAVRVSIICFAPKTEGQRVQLDGETVAEVFADLTAGAFSLTTLNNLTDNSHISFIGTQKNGPFDIPAELARSWLIEPMNVNSRPNSDVIKPWANGSSITQSDNDLWIIDFGPSLAEEDAALYEQPFSWVVTKVKPTRVSLRRDGHRKFWWRHGEARPGMRFALHPLTRYICTPRVSKHRLFVWLDKSVLPDSATVVIARDDDTSFGILHSRFHEAWALRLGTSLEDRPRYTPTTCFETFPFPDGLTPNIPAAAYGDDPRAQRIAAAARRLDELRRAWLNPPDLVEIVPEVVPGYPDRIIPKSDEAAAILKKRTLTNLYNARPAWLASAHAALDAAVAAAYGWPDDISTEEALARLFALNQARAAQAK